MNSYNFYFMGGGQKQWTVLRHNGPMFPPPYKKHNVPVYMLGFPRTISKLKEYDIDLGNILVIDLLPFKAYLTAVYNCKFYFVKIKLFYIAI